MNKLKKTIPYIINALLVTCIFFIALKLNNIYPFGEYIIPKHDAIHQYQPMLFNFITKLKEGILVNYSFNNSLGLPFIFNFLYYLSSPLNILVIPFKSADSMFLSIIIIKIIITSITTTFYVKRRTNNNYLATIISISYIFSSWFLAYYYTIMWLDAFMIFPLFQYGLEELMNKNKYNIYIFSLAYIMISNFYIAFMICLYTLVYYLYNIIIKKDKYLNKIKNFQLIMFCTIITCLLSAFHIYATYDSFLNMGISINNIANDNTTIPILNMIKAFLSGSKIVNLMPNGEIFPNIALSTIFTISSLYFFINPKISKKDKITNLISFIFIIILFYSKTLNYIMNCFHVPIGYNFRYSFIISFYLITLFIKNYKAFDNKIDKRIYCINIILLLIILLEFFMNNLDLKYFIFNLSFLLIITLLFIFHNNSKVYKIIFVSIIILEVTISSIFNITSTIKKDTITHNFNNEFTTYRENPNYKTSYDYDLNLNLYDNKNTISSFSSMQYNRIYENIFALGCSTDNKAIISNCTDTHTFNMLFNIKDNNNYYLEKIYAANNSIYETYLIGQTIIDNQNLLLEGLTGIKEVATKKELNNISSTNEKYQYKITQNGTYYLNITDEKLEQITINNTIYTYDKTKITDTEKEIIEVKNQSYLELNLNKNDIIKIIYRDTPDNDNLTLYKLNQDKLDKAYKQLKTNQIKYTNYQDNLLEGEITVNKNQVIFTTIPYDEHWEITIDNKKVAPKIVLNSLLAFDCPEGTHRIKLEYKNNYLIPTIISISTFVCLIINIIYQKIKKRNEQ